MPRWVVARLPGRRARAREVKKDAGNQEEEEEEEEETIADRLRKRRRTR